jgi:lipoprotein-releasing system ATP-binding protein
MSEGMVSLVGVAKGYGSGSTRVEVLRGLDLELPEGELVAVVGPSGVGKSTLLYVIGLLDRPEKGTVRLGGRNVTGLDADGRAALRNTLIGFVFQHHHLLDELDARDNVALPMRIGGHPARVARRRASELLEAVNLAGKEARFPDQLSGGDRQS